LNKVKGSSLKSSYIKLSSNNPDKWLDGGKVGELVLPRTSYNEVCFKYTAY
jgi:hypothetical protein